ncbi:MAG: fimbrillin family protein [Bacteroidales bacterium]|nr:fimbrillin family protein [Bacteroidales bacterium]
MKAYHSLLYSLLFLTAAGMAGCADDDAEGLPSDDGVTVKISLTPFEGEHAMRTTTDGLNLEVGDKFRMKIICPHTGAHQSGELWSSGFYEFTIDKFTVDNSREIYISGGQAIESQATTYVYTAQNTTARRIFVVNDYRYNRPSNFFCADQSKLEHFKQSDVIWAQAVRQTGAKEVHLMFSHKVARLDITIDDSGLTQDVEGVPTSYPLSPRTHLTLEGMPDIDGAELVVGDYYADQCYENEIYSYREKASCSYENNGRVLGIEVLEETLTEETPKRRSSIAPITGCPTPGGDNSKVLTPVPNTATYTAYNDRPRHYLLYVPPCVLNAPAVFWIRDGERRYSAPLSVTTFEEGKLYPVTVKLTDASAVVTP